MIKEEVNIPDEIYHRIPASLFRDISLDDSPVSSEELSDKSVLEEPCHKSVSEEPCHKSVLEEPCHKSVLEEPFQKKLQGLCKKKQERYEKNKPTYHYQDQNYRFHQEYVVTLAKYHNIPIPTVDRSLTLADLPLKSRRKH